MRRTQSGFTLIELLIVIGIIGVLAAALLPQLMQGQDAANALADQQNLRTHYQWMLDYKRKHSDMLPSEAGYKFVMSTWTAGGYDHTPENLDRFFTPGPAKTNDPQYASLLKMIKSDPKLVWPDLASTSTLDTHYVGRAKAHFRTRENGADEAWMADDNENGYNLRDGTINVLFYGSTVRTYSYQELKEQHGLGDMSNDAPVPTWGPNSPIAPCQKLDN